VLLVLAVLAIAAPAAFAGPGSISGQAYTVASAPLENIHVYAVSVTDSTDVYGPAWTDALGNYTLYEVPAGQYYVEFYEGFRSDVSYTTGAWVPMLYKAGTPPWCSLWNPAASVPTAVTVPDNTAVAGIGTAMVVRSHITGTVTYNAVAAPGIEVYVYNPETDGPDYAAFAAAASAGDLTPDDYTDAAGAYDVGGLLPTPYDPAYYWVFFNDPSGTYAPEWYADNYWAYGGDNVLPAFGLNAVADEALELAGSLSGHLDGADPYDGHEMDMAGVTVELWNWVTMVKFAETVTDSEGNYAFYGVPAGLYAVYVDSPEGYLPEWYNNKTSWLGSTAITVTAGAHTHGINMWLDLMPALESIVHPPFGVNDGPTVTTRSSP